jgi:predicted nuclease with RNAse H fold
MRVPKMMSFEKTTFVGIDPSGGRFPFTYAAFDQGCQLVAVAACELEEVLAFLGRLQEVVVAINAPRNPNTGLVRKKLEQQHLAPGHLRGADMRQAEFDLRERGISVSPTASRQDKCAAWMQTGFDFYRILEELGYKPFPSINTTHQWLETHPQAAYCALLGQILLPKPTLEGRLQRQLVLYEQNLGIKDPMEFFEEITRHRFLKGVLPMEIIYSAEELDALVAAFTAYHVVFQPTQVVWVGDTEEGQIAIPVSGLQASYF